MADYILRAISKDVGVRALVGVTTEVVREAAQRHAAYPIAAAALGHGLTAGVLLGATMKIQERVALKIEGNGRLRKMVIEADAYGHVRGYVAVPDAPSDEALDRDAVSDALGHEGLLTVVKDLRLKEPYRSVVALDQGGALDKELENYLNQSEQIPSRVDIGTLMDDAGEVAAAGGILVQALPGHGHDALERLEATLGSLPQIETLIGDGLTPEEIVARIFGGKEYIVLEQRPVEFRCTCSRERSRQALKMLEVDDLLALILEGEATADCHFCYARYQFDLDELERILEEVETERGAEEPSE
jgi:molecular chaperone Hsp33